MNSNLILGDIEVNKINGKYLPEQLIYDIDLTKINDDTSILISFDELSINEPLPFTCLWNNNLFFPDFKWIDTGLLLIIRYYT